MKENVQPLDVIFPDVIIRKHKYPAFILYKQWFTIIGGILYDKSSAGIMKAHLSREIVTSSGNRLKLSQSAT